ncbi:MAG TPA: response regulator transcription factor [Candidatus Sulfotelmatobacter sp.]|nr:response regulator transcription factor [Candidatus Sulfotelmatobacter sp.]
MKTSGISIIVVDDYQPWRDYACSILPQWLDSPRIAEARDGLEGVRKAEELQPDLILLDVGLPELNGIESARRIREISPHSKILFVSEDRSPEIAEEGLRTGARGYITKSSAASELWPAIQAVLRGEVFLGKGLSLIASGDSSQPSRMPTPVLEDVPMDSQSEVELDVAAESPARPARLTGLWRVFATFPSVGWATLVVVSGTLGFFAGSFTPRFSTTTSQTASVTPKHLSSKSVKSKAPTRHAQSSNSRDAKRLVALQTHKRHLQELLNADQKQIAALQRKRRSRAHATTDPQITAEHYQKALLSALAELRSLKETQTSRDAELVATRYRLSELEREIAEQRGLANRSSFANNDGRSIAMPSALELRNLIAARNLHVADVSDVNTTENEPKPFGRVFYTRGKSLVLFAYDLSKSQPNQTFYAWGARQSDPHRPQSLGALRTDDQTQRRWILEFSDPKVLAQIDSVYVTLEPTNKPGYAPNGRKLLSAYLGPSPKYH